MLLLLNCQVGKTESKKNGMPDLVSKAKLGLKGLKPVLDVDRVMIRQSKIVPFVFNYPRMLRGEKTRIPLFLLLLTGVWTFADLEKLSVEAIDAISSSKFSQSFGNDKPDKKLSKADEGYLTEDSGLGCNPLPDVMMFASKARPCGPLASALKNRCHSKSVSGQATPPKCHAFPPRIVVLA